MEEMGLNKDDYQFYLDLRKYGSATFFFFSFCRSEIVEASTGFVTDANRVNIAAAQRNLIHLFFVCEIRVIDASLPYNSQLLTVRPIIPKRSRLFI